MGSIDLFSRAHIVGVFRGFREGGLEFHADLTLPYKSHFQSIPMHGQFLLVQLETPDAAVLGRIVSLSSEGKLASGSGEEFNIRAVQDNRPIPEDLRKQYLKYRVNIRVLGVLRINAHGKLVFAPSHRRLPHVGSPVAFPSEEVLREIAGHNRNGASIGYLALGEYIYAQKGQDVVIEDWMQMMEQPDVLIKFPIENLVSRRSFILARAGFGKSNLNKLLFSKLYEQTPTVKKRSGKQVPVGTIIFDRDGEYFWPDDKGRAGLCDVPTLQDKLVVFTSRKAPSAFYQSFVAGGIKLDLRRLKPADVIGIALSAERQEQQNVRKLAAVSQEGWVELVNLISPNKNQTPLKEIMRLLQLDNKQEIEALAARGNMTTIVQMLHDPGSQLMDMLFGALSEGKLCIVDVSQMRSGPALVLSGLILRQIFDRNQAEFTAAEPKTIPTIAVVEEAQAVLNERASAAEPYITWVKEGRKYDLGALLITQQPGSIPTEILSQGDNWFIFHLLSSADLLNLQRANAHFSEDLLSTLLNEPIAGQGVFWSSVSGTPYPVPLRVLSFEHMYSALDPTYTKGSVDTFARRLQAEYQHLIKQALLHKQGDMAKPDVTAQEDQLTADEVDQEGPDVLEICKRKALEALEHDAGFMQKMQNEGVSWGFIVKFLEEYFPSTFQDRNRIALNLVRTALDTFFGREGEGWHSYRDLERNNRLYVRAGKG
ncbi:MAG TPA: ATP-binding protein [Ktedonobacterales bacterium]|jgi:hypothetical protein